jgi:integrase
MITEVPTTMSEACDYYIDTTTKLRKLSNHSITTYGHCKTAFFRYLQDDHKAQDLPLTKLSTAIAKGYRAWLNDAKYANDTIHLYVNFIKMVIQTVLEDFPMDECPELGVKFNPFNAKRIYQIKKKANLMDFIHPHLVKKMWELKNEPYGLMSLFMVYSGYSFVDCCTEPEFTIDLDGNKFLTYHRHKSGVLARVVMYEELDKIIALILEGKFKEKYNNWLPLGNFLEPDGRIIMAKHESEYARFSAYCKGPLSELMGRKVTPHVLRHSFAVLLLERGHSLTAVSKSLGHESVITTEKYYGHVSNERLVAEKNQIFNIST